MGIKFNISSTDFSISKKRTFVTVSGLLFIKENKSPKEINPNHNVFIEFSPQ
jgi:glucose uptake protein GlcU